MTRRSVRVTLVCLGVLATAALSYRVFVDEQLLTSQRDQLTSIDDSINDVLRSLSDVRGALHAYVAPGQRPASWESQSAALIDRLRQQLMALDGAADSLGTSLTASLDNLDQLSAAEKRVRHYLDFSQPLLAGDVIFTEIRDLVEATGQQVVGVRDALRRDAHLRISQARQEQAMLLGGGVALWIGLALLLALLPTSSANRASAPVANLTPVALAATSAADSFDLSLAPRPSGRPAEPSPAAIAVEPLETVESPQDAHWRGISSICKELSSAADLGQIAQPLARACEALGARDAIVWVASTDGTTLAAQASHGFDERLLARIGSIDRDGANLTAAAFRDGQPHVSTATASAPGALAVALRGPFGSVGVLSVELEPEADTTAAVDLATTFAAQIAPLALQAQAAVPAEFPQRLQA